MHLERRCRPASRDLVLPAVLFGAACGDASSQATSSSAGDGAGAPIVSVPDSASADATAASGAGDAVGQGPGASGQGAGDSGATTAPAVGTGGGTGDGGAPQGGGRGGAGDGGAPTATTSDAATSDAASSAEATTAPASTAESAAATTSGSDATTSGGATTASSGSGGDPGAMTFFVTSVGNGTGNFGGVPGADAFCQSLAAAVGAGDRTWRAYLSTAVEAARARIGAGPWFDSTGALVASDVASLHAQGITNERARDEHGNLVPNGTTHPGANEHDILTGSNQDGTFSGRNCADFTSASPDLAATAGHCDASFTGGSPVDPSDNWNSTHDTQGCDAASLFDTGSSGRIYCFAP